MRLCEDILEHDGFRFRHFLKTAHDALVAYATHLVTAKGHLAGTEETGAVDDHSAAFEVARNLHGFIDVA